jgi:nucleotide-binding universal stress UspA family protein
MSAVATPAYSHPFERAGRPELRSNPAGPASPVVAAVDGSSATTAAIETAVRLGADLGASVLFVYVRRGPGGFLGAPLYQRRLTTAMARARAVLDRALLAAAWGGVAADAEILEGSPRKRILELARNRGARMVVFGHRRRMLGRSVSRAVVARARQPVVVAPKNRRRRGARVPAGR